MYNNRYIHRYFKDDVIHVMEVSINNFHHAKELFDTGRSYSLEDVAKIFPNAFQHERVKILRILGIMQENGEFYKQIVTHSEKKVEY